MSNPFVQRETPYGTFTAETTGLGGIRNALGWGYRAADGAGLFGSTPGFVSAEAARKQSIEQEAKRVEALKAEEQEWVQQYPDKTEREAAQQKAEQMRHNEMEKAWKKAHKNYAPREQTFSDILATPATKEEPVAPAPVKKPLPKVSPHPFSEHFDYSDESLGLPESFTDLEEALKDLQEKEAGQWRNNVVAKLEDQLRKFPTAEGDKRSLDERRTQIMKELQELRNKPLPDVIPQLNKERAERNKQNREAFEAELAEYRARVGEEEFARGPNPVDVPKDEAPIVYRSRRVIGGLLGAIIDESKVALSNIGKGFGNIYEAREQILKHLLEFLEDDKLLQDSMATIASDLVPSDSYMDVVKLHREKPAKDFVDALNETRETMVVGLPIIVNAIAEAVRPTPKSNEELLSDFLRELKKIPSLQNQRTQQERSNRHIRSLGGPPPTPFLPPNSLQSLPQEPTLKNSGKRLFARTVALSRIVSTALITIPFSFFSNSTRESLSSDMAVHISELINPLEIPKTYFEGLTGFLSIIGAAADIHGAVAVIKVGSQIAQGAKIFTLESEVAATTARLASKIAGLDAARAASATGDTLAHVPVGKPPLVPKGPLKQLADLPYKTVIYEGEAAIEIADPAFVDAVKSIKSGLESAKGAQKVLSETEGRLADAERILASTAQYSKSEKAAAEAIKKGILKLRQEAMAEALPKVQKALDVFVPEHHAENMLGLSRGTAASEGASSAASAAEDASRLAAARRVGRSTVASEVASSTAASGTSRLPASSVATAREVGSVRPPHVGPTTGSRSSYSVKAAQSRGTAELTYAEEMSNKYMRATSKAKSKGKSLLPSDEQYYRYYKTAEGYGTPDTAGKLRMPPNIKSMSPALREELIGVASRLYHSDVGNRVGDLLKHRIILTGEELFERFPGITSISEGVELLRAERHCLDKLTPTRTIQTTIDALELELVKVQNNLSTLRAKLTTVSTVPAGTKLKLKKGDITRAAKQVQASEKLQSVIDSQLKVLKNITDKGQSVKDALANAETLNLYVKATQNPFVLRSGYPFLNKAWLNKVGDNIAGRLKYQMLLGLTQEQAENARTILDTVQQFRKLIEGGLDPDALAWATRTGFRLGRDQIDHFYEITLIWAHCCREKINPFSHPEILRLFVDGKKSPLGLIMNELNNYWPVGAELNTAKSDIFHILLESRKAKTVEEVYVAIMDRLDVGDLNQFRDYLIAGDKINGASRLGKFDALIATAAPEQKVFLEGLKGTFVDLEDQLRHIASPEFKQLIDHGIPARPGTQQAIPFTTPPVTTPPVTTPPVTTSGGQYGGLDKVATTNSTSSDNTIVSYNREFNSDFDNFSSTILFKGILSTSETENSETENPDPKVGNTIRSKRFESTGVIRKIMNDDYYVRMNNQNENNDYKIYHSNDFRNDVDVIPLPIWGSTQRDKNGSTYGPAYIPFNIDIHNIDAYKNLFDKIIEGYEDVQIEIINDTLTTIKNPDNYLEDEDAQTTTSTPSEKPTQQQATPGAPQIPDNNACPNNDFYDKNKVIVRNSPFYNDVTNMQTYIGLLNPPTNTGSITRCFMNSAIQMLYSVLEFRQFFIKDPSDNMNWTPHEVKNSEHAKYIESERMRERRTKRDIYNQEIEKYTKQLFAMSYLFFNMGASAVLHNQDNNMYTYTEGYFRRVYTGRSYKHFRRKLNHEYNMRTANFCINNRPPVMNVYKVLLDNFQEDMQQDTGEFLLKILTLLSAHKTPISKLFTILYAKTKIRTDKNKWDLIKGRKEELTTVENNIDSIIKLTKISENDTINTLLNKDFRINGNTVSDTIPNLIYQERTPTWLEKVEIPNFVDIYGTGIQYTQLIIPPTTKYLFVQLGRYENQLARNSSRVLFTPFINIDGNIFKVKGCISHVGGESIHSGHYVYLNFNLTTHGLNMTLISDKDIFESVQFDQVFPNLTHNGRPLSVINLIEICGYMFLYERSGYREQFLIESAMPFLKDYFIPTAVTLGGIAATIYTGIYGNPGFRLTFSRGGTKKAHIANIKKSRQKTVANTKNSGIKGTVTKQSKHKTRRYKRYLHRSRKASNKKTK